jgi:hypothetical protein
MSEPLQRKPILTAQAVGDLHRAKRQIMAAVVGKVPEPLALATMQAALRLACDEAEPAEVLSERVLELVRQTLMSLAQQKWKPDTALLLHKHRKEGGHELTQ